MLIVSRNVGLLLISSMVSGQLDQLSILWKLHRIEFLGCLIIVAFTYWSLMEFQVGYFTLFHCFLAIDGSGWDGSAWFWVGSCSNNIQLMLELFKAPFLGLLFSYYALMTLLMMLYLIFPSMLMASSTTLMAEQASDLWQQLELAFELQSDLGVIVQWGRK